MTLNFRLPSPIGLLSSVGLMVLAWGSLGQSASAQSLLYPATRDPNGIMVTGVGVASTEPDTAELTLIVSKGMPIAPMAPSRRESPLEDSPEDRLPSLTEADLRPIVSALSQTGGSSVSVRSYVQDEASYRSGVYMTPGSGAIVVKVAQPTRPILKALVDSADKAIAQAKLRSQTRRLSYSLQDCTNLEAQAYQAAIKNAQQHAQAIAKTLNVTLEDKPSVAEAFYSTFYPSACNKDPISTFGPNNSGEPFNPDREPSVSLRKDLFVTYKLK